MGAVTAREQIYVRTEQHQRLVDVIMRRAEIILEADERKGLLFRAAQIYEEMLESPDEAIRVYQTVFDIDDADPRAIDALERLYNQSGSEPHASQARDLADLIVEGAAFDGKDPVLSPESFDKVLRMFEPHRRGTEVAG